MVVIAVALPLPRFLDFDYLHPNPLPVGVRVRVPWGQGERIGIVRGSGGESSCPRERLKPILEVIDQTPLYPAELWRTLEFVARYYQYPLGPVLFMALPERLRRGEHVATELPAWRRTEAPGAGVRGPVQVRLLELLTAAPRSEAELTRLLPGWRAAARRLAQLGLIEACRLAPASPPRSAVAAPALNAEQHRAQAAIVAAAGRFQVLVLEGVTGSGKTEVYLAAIGAALGRGEQALLLCPEIGLTPQLLARVAERLPAARVGVLHSERAAQQRAWVWAAAAEHRLDVVLGTRSAVFTPFARLGLIVVDEEHDPSYKQLEGAHYHARDVALVRARDCGIPVVLGSATPAFETLRALEEGRYRHLRLTRRARGDGPRRIELVDLRGQRLAAGLAPRSLAAIEQTLAARGQVLVFRNRRGYAPILLCHDCGWRACCPGCGQSYTLHRSRARLRCHRCGVDAAVPAACPQCSSLALVGQGVGTERLEEGLAQRFPNVPIWRVDRDSTARKGRFEEILAAIGRGTPGIVVGTQMLAKGHDWPELGLVLVVGVDGALYSTDFRAAERTVQLLLQVAGRTGRGGRSGAILIQTHDPHSPLLRALLRGDYRAAVAPLLAERRAAALPPYAHAVLLRAEAVSAEALAAFLERAAAALPSDPGWYSPGPSGAPFERRRGRHRGQLLVIAESRPALRTWLEGWVPTLADLATNGVRYAVDVDPHDLS